MSEEELSHSPGAPEAEAPDANQEIARLEKQVHDQEGQYRRLAADFENYRRRQNSEREELIKSASARVLEELLPVLDNFERAIASSRSATEIAKVVTGVEQIYRLLVDALSRQGVAPMDAQGKPFDPNLHEAISQVENTSVPDQSVLVEIQKGYYLNGKVLRHAMVQVANNPNGPEAANDVQASPVAAGMASANPPVDVDKEDNHE